VGRRQDTGPAPAAGACCVLRWGSCMSFFIYFLYLLEKERWGQMSWALDSTEDLKLV
jgi:hypothetical protein